MNRLNIFEIPLFDNPTPQPVQYLEVRVQFKDTNFIETVNFQSLNVFKFVADDVTVLRWKHISELDDSKEIEGEGTSFETMSNYFSQLEADALKAEKAKKNKR
jgi:hypothetical protein